MNQRFTVGDTFGLTTTLAAYPASAGWVLKHRLVPRDGRGAAITITCTAQGDDHAAAVAAADTATWVAGAYSRSSWVELGAVKHSVSSGQITLLPDPRSVKAPIDTRSDAEVALAKVRAMIRGTASAGVQSYTINGRQLSRYSIGDLLKLEAKLALDVQRELNAAAMAAGMKSRRRLMVRCTNA